MKIKLSREQTPESGEREADGLSRGDDLERQADGPLDIVVDAGRIAYICKSISAEGETADLAGLVSFQYVVDDEAGGSIGHRFQGILIPCEFGVVEHLVYLVPVPIKEGDRQAKELMVGEIDRDVPCALFENEVDQVRGFLGTAVSVECGDNTR